MALPAGAVLAPAKVNLALHVTGRRPDGYHILSSLVAFASGAAGDRLTARSAAEDALDLTGPFAAALAASLPDGGANILAETLALARRVAARQDAELPPLHLVLDKRLPIASGIGGGSADAAALLRLVGEACPRLAAPLAEAALALGADVPMCLAGRAARIGGIGESIEPLQDFPSVAAVLVNPGVPVATPLVFARLERRDNPPMPPLPKLADLGALLAYLEDTRNDLEPPAVALAPAIGAARAALVSGGAGFARMSGSGATVFGLFGDDAAAARAAAAIRAAEPGWWCVPTRLGEAQPA
ncbi:4-(cytidine 5'-diphospho)-2-C-methyl-D-erythritol kinase [Aureimonas endophytica]|nr:4-(cytidine 5'-diphospho)-2-C-methyl-D-erythritol kinase [Aureimonas endophytica]